MRERITDTQNILKLMRDYCLNVDCFPEGEEYKRVSTCDEWCEDMEVSITPQKMAAMAKVGYLVKHDRDRKYWGDDKVRYSLPR